MEHITRAAKKNLHETKCTENDARFGSMLPLKKFALIKIIHEENI